MIAFSAGKRHVYEAVNLIPDVITTANSFPDTASPARVAQWRACRTHDLVVASSFPG